MPQQIAEVKPQNISLITLIWLIVSLFRRRYLNVGLCRSQNNDVDITTSKRLFAGLGFCDNLLKEYIRSCRVSKIARGGLKQ